jgi:hypothetical protein
MKINDVLRWVVTVFGLASVLLLASCYETKQEFVINPDGSGKVTHECSFQNMQMGNEDADEEEKLQAAIAGIIKNSKGVDAWKDVSFKSLDDGRMWFRGTAYFKKIEDLEIQNQSMLSFSWKNLGGGKGELTMDLKKSDDTAAKPKADADKLTAEERAKKLKQERAKFKESKPMLAAMLGGLKQTARFRLPGKPGARTNFKPGEGGSIQIEFVGEKMIATLEKLMADDEWLMKNGFDAQSPPDMDAVLAGGLFGEKAPVKAAVTDATKPMFDYAAEVAAARKQADELQKKLGVVSVAAPAKGGELKKIEVVGVRISRKVDKKLDLRPFNYDAGYTLAVLAEFPGSVLSVTDKSVLTSATASDGKSLLKGDADWDKRLGFPKLSADKASVLFDVELTMPGAGVTGLKEISGVIEYRVAGGSKEVDLGLKSLKAGEKSAELGASIENIKDGWQKDGSQDLELKVKMNSDDLKAAYLVVDGVRSELERSGYSGSNNSTNFTFSSDKNGFPDKGNIILEIHDKVEVFKTPFKLENLNLLGTPEKP